VVYFVQRSPDGPIKLGASSNFTTRYASLQSASADILNVLGVIHCSSRSEAFGLEDMLKQRFKSLRKQGEWLTPAKELLSYIAERVVPEQEAPNELANTRGPNAATKSGFKGVYAYGKRWAAVFFANGARQRLGVWDTPEEAARAYDRHLVVLAGGDLNAAVNFPSPLDDLQTAGAGFVERFATGEPLTDIEYAAWQRATQNRAVPERGPLSILPASTDATKVDAHMPLMNRPAVGLYRRDSAPHLPDPEPAPPPDFVSPPLDDPDLDDDDA
jgi:hypothetical protein